MEDQNLTISSPPAPCASAAVSTQCSTPYECLSESETEDIQQKYLTEVPAKPHSTHATVEAVDATYNPNPSLLSHALKAGVVAYMWHIARRILRNCYGDVFMMLWYVTHWAWVLEMLYFCFALHLDVAAHVLRGNARLLPVWLRRACHSLGELAWTLQMLTFISFWFYLYPAEWRTRSLAWEFHVHIVGISLIMFDLMYRKEGFFMRNNKLVFRFGVFYTLLHWMVVEIFGEVYPGLNFRNFFSIFLVVQNFFCVYQTHKLACAWWSWGTAKTELQTAGDFAHLLFVRKASFDRGSQPNVITAERENSCWQEHHQQQQREFIGN